MATIGKFLSDNSGWLSFIAVVVALPPFFVLVWSGFRKWRPSQLERLKSFQAEAARAANLKNEIETRATWDKEHCYYGEYLVRDAERKLPHTFENHSSQEAAHSIMALTAITSEYLEFTNGSFGITYIKLVADSWQFTDSGDEDAKKVWAVYWLNYRDIVYVRWETDDYWDRPQICCRFPAKQKWPFVEMFYADRQELGGRPHFKRICRIRDVEKKRRS